LKKKKEKNNASAASSALIEFLSITFTDFKKSLHNYLFLLNFFSPLHLKLIVLCHFIGARNKSFVNSIALLCKGHKKYRNKTAREKPNAVPFSPPILPQQQASKFANTVFFSEKLPHPRPLIAKSSLDRANACYEEVCLQREERLDEGAISYLCRINPGGMKELLGTGRISWQEDRGHLQQTPFSPRVGGGSQEEPF